MTQKGVDDVMRYALKAISSNRISELELETKLRQAFADQKDGQQWVVDTMERLKTFRILDDRRIASQLARRHSAKGNAFIRERLTEKGLSIDAIEQAIDELDPEYIRALTEALKQWPKYKGDFSDIGIERLRHFLQSRGYPATICNNVMIEFANQRQRVEEVM